MAQSQIQIKLKMISSENAHNKGNVWALCLPSHRAGLWPWEALTYVWEDCALSWKKPINWEFLITFLMVFCVKPPIISAVPVLLSSSSPESLGRLRIKSSAGQTETGITRKRKMHLGVIRQTAGLPLCSLSSHGSHNPHLRSPIPPPAMTAEWNLNPGITPASPLLPHPPSPLTSNSESVRGQGERGHGHRQPSVNPVPLFLPFNTFR